MASKKKGKNKKDIEIEDEFTPIPSQKLQELLQQQKQTLEKTKEKRNYIMTDRDMIEKFYHNVLKEIEEIETKIQLKKSDAEKLELDHQVEVKVHLQNVILLEHQQEKDNKAIQLDGEQAKQKEDKYQKEKIKEMLERKKELKQKYNVVENQNIFNVGQLNEDQKNQLGIAQKDYNDRIKNHIQKYEEKLKKLKEDLELKLKVELHELEERKNLHINELMENHEKAFTQLKNYYNDITKENLNLIKAQKEEIARINQQLNANTKLITEMKAKNKKLEDEKKLKEKEREEKIKKISQYVKDQMSLENLKSKQIGLANKIQKLQSQREELDKNYEDVLKQKSKLDEKFESITNEVKDHSQLQNNILEERLVKLQQIYEEKEAQLEQVLTHANLDQNLYNNLKLKIKTSIEQKNQLIKSLKYSIHHATKTYNDAIRVYEAKLVEFGIPPDELGFQQLDTQTSIMPAGLVSS